MILGGQLTDGIPVILFNLIITIMLFGSVASEFASAIVNTTSDHVCYHEETYTELVRTPIKQPVKVRSYNWCFDFPPRCSNYKTEVREVVKVQNMTRVKIIEKCCDGYADIKTNNETICQPICRGGCGKGFCVAPNQCTCDIGYTGRHCTQRCQHGKWGANCRNICKCRNGALCDNKTGLCRCTEGWIGEFCDQPCSEDHYGLMCKSQCECSSMKCNPKTGECVMEDGHILFDNGTFNFTGMLENGTKSSNERIEVNQWVQVKTTNGTTKMEQIPEKPAQKDFNSTSSIIETLNSTIADLTENIDKLAKNIDKTHQIMTSEAPTILLQEAVVEITTMKAVQEVIFIKHDEPSAAILLHDDDSTAILETKKPISTKPKEIIHVITNWNERLQSPQMNQTSPADQPHSPQMHDWNALVIVLILFSIIIIATSAGFVIMYRRYLRKQRETSPTPLEAKSDPKVLAKPLPDLPAFTQNLTRKVEFYDQPKNNSAVKRPSGPYHYTSGSSIYSVVSKSSSRKGSLEHIYDEIKYPSVSNSKL